MSHLDAMRQRVINRKGDARHVAVPTPEGIDLRLQVATVPARAKALFLDLLFIGFATFAVLTIASVVSALLGGTGYLLGIGLLVVFLIRNFYFMGFELYGHGRTPGKRIAGIRVVNREGGQLGGEALFVRNVTRDVELFLPVYVLIEPSALVEGAEGWGILLSSVWLMIFALLPLFNRERLRVGDLLAGTVVVSYAECRRPLFDDIAVGTMMRVSNQRPVYTFAPDQLDMYGEFELFVLEDVLRIRRGVPPDARAMSVIAECVRKKIGWDPEDWEVDTNLFLRDFYAALRARRERGNMMGQRQEHKREGALQRVRASTLVVPHRSGEFSSVFGSVARPVSEAQLE